MFISHLVYMLLLKNSITQLFTYGISGLLLSINIMRWEVPFPIQPAINDGGSSVTKDRIV